MNQMIFVFAVVLVSTGVFSVRGEPADDVLGWSNENSNQTAVETSPKTLFPPNCIPIPPISTTALPALVSIAFSSNCDFCDHDLYTLTCIQTAFDCAARCGLDSRCTHFTYIANLNGGTCRLKRAVRSGGAWATIIPSPSAYVCGYIPVRTFTNTLLNLCVGLHTALGLVPPNK